MTSFAAALQQLLAALDQLEIPFVVGGSIASGTHGLPRQTNGVDIVADLSRERARELCQLLGSGFYADAETVVRAVEAGRPFTVIHLQGAYKFDIFPAGEDRFAHSELARRRYMNSSLNGVDRIELPVATAEDTILAKLVWFRKGGEISDRQWHDILGIIQVQREHLDAAYLERWAGDLGASDLPEARAFLMRSSTAGV